VIATTALWRTWSFSPLVVAGLVVTAALYARGVAALWRRGRGRGVPGWRTACFAGGLVALVAALVSPLDAASQDLLWAHMAQHLILIVVAAPLVVLGAPLVPFALALPLRWRVALRRFGRQRPVAAGGRALGHPVIVWLLHVAALWAWHVPSLYQAALTSTGVHALEHACFLGTAVAFWWLVLRPSGRRRLVPGADVLYVFLAGVAGGALGALFTFAGTPLYPVYASRSVLYGLSPLTDQQLAGLMMWIPAGLVYLAASGVLFVRWLQGMDAVSSRRLPGASRPSLSMPGGRGTLVEGRNDR
jgi:putative membrane protein